MVFTNTALSSLLSWTGANGLRSAREASAKQTMSGGVWICIRMICVIFLSKSKGKMLVQAGIRWYRKGDVLCVPPAGEGLYRNSELPEIEFNYWSSVDTAHRNHAQ